jgi:2Fe-2S ferredoxin
MPRLTIVTREGVERTVTGQAGLSVMEVIRSAGIDEVLAVCGGCCACATCHVYVDSGFLQQLSQMTEDENGMLDSTNHRKNTSRLSCQLRFTDEVDGLRIVIAPED